MLYAVNRTNGGPYDFTSSNNDATYGSLGSGEVYAFHPGGANVALGDGSARLISRDTPIAVFAGWSLAPEARKSRSTATSSAVRRSFAACYGQRAAKEACRENVSRNTK